MVEHAEICGKPVLACYGLRLAYEALTAQQSQFPHPLSRKESTLVLQKLTLTGREGASFVPFSAQNSTTPEKRQH